MKRRMCSVAALACFVLGSALAYAETYQARIPFSFTVGEKLHPAGSYAVAYDKSNPKTLSLRPQSGATIQASILTRLAPKETSRQEAQLVFDEVDGKHTLAELYIPGMDGFYLGSVLVEHKHVVIHAPR